MIHASKYQPRCFPVKGDLEPAEIDRAQSIDPTESLNREKKYEIGRTLPVGYIKKSPSIGYRLTQLEYGNIEFWQKLANTESKGDVGEDALTLDDFKTPYFDICAYLTDDDGTFRGTILYPSLRTSGFSITVGEPQGDIERSFDFVGEGAHIFKGDNKYYIQNKHTCGSGGDNEIDLSAKAPASLRDGTYMFRVTHYDATDGSTVELESGVSGYSYSNATKILTINATIDTNDIIKAYYTSATAPDVIFTENDSDVVGITGESAEIYLYIPATGKPDADDDYIYRLQSVTLDVRFEREDLREIGNKDVVQRGIREKTVTATLGRILETFTIEEILNGSDSDHIDVSQLSDEVALIVKFYSDNSKTTFKYGLKCTEMSPTELRGGGNANEYINRENVLEGSDLSITADESLLV